MFGMAKAIEVVIDAEASYVILMRRAEIRVVRWKRIDVGQRWDW